jgi:hypothetical protein
VRKYIFAIIFLFYTGPVYAAAPVIFFTDTVDGNRTGWEGSNTVGQAVTVWGLGFGSADGTNKYVSCAGQTIYSNGAGIGEWGATTSPTTARSLQRITFWLNSSMSTGAQSITVTTTEGTSNSLPFYVRTSGDCYYIATDGNDSNDGSAPDSGHAWLTPGKARSTLTAGDAVYMKGGTYSTTDAGASTCQMGFIGDNHNNGSSNDSILVTAYPGENVVWSDLTYNIRQKVTGTNGSELYYWTFSKINMLSNSHTTSWGTIGDGAHYNTDTHIRFIGNLMKTEGGGGTALDIGADLGSTYMFILGNYFPDSGVDSHGQTASVHNYCIYIEGEGAHDYTFIGYNEFYSNTYGKAIQIYGHWVTDTCGHIYVFNNIISEMSEVGVVMSGGDSGAGHLGEHYDFVQFGYFWGNIIYDCNYGGGGTREAFQLLGAGGGKYGGEFYVWNNTFGYSYEPTPGDALTFLGYPTSVELKNNLIISTSSFYEDATFEDSSYPTAAHNLYYGGASDIPAWETDELTSDPVFTDAANGDYTISSDGAASDTGTPITPLGWSASSYPNDIWDIDYDYIGQYRGTFSIGAYESGSGESPAAPSISSGVLSGVRFGGD